MTVVFDAQVDSTVAPQAHREPVGFAMPAGVCDRLAQDAEQILLGIGRHANLLVDVKGKRQLRACAEVLGGLTDSHRQWRRLARGEHRDRTPGFVQRTVRCVRERIEQLGCRRTSTRRARLAGDERELVGQTVVKVAGDPAVMLADGGEAIADLTLLRDQPDVFGSVASTPTA